MRIILMGPPGAGKGTQAKRIVEKFEMDHLSSGDIFRGEKASGSQLGAELAEYMDAGKLVPDDTVVKIMAKAVERSHASGGLMLDGFPRTLAQAVALDAQLAKSAKPIQAVVIIRAKDESIIERITGRRSCPKCGKAFHVKFIPSEKGRFCDVCNTMLTQRSDDKEDVVKERIAIYNEQTEPVIEYYSGRDDLDVIEIDGSPAPDDVTVEMIKAIETFQTSK